MAFTFIVVPSLTRPLSFDTDCESFFGQLPSYQEYIEAQAALCLANATTLLSIEEIAAVLGAAGLTFTDDHGIVFSDGSKILRSAGSGLKIIPHSDSYSPTVRNALDDADVLVLKPPSNADALTGTSTTEPLTPENLAYVLDNRVGIANSADIKVAINAGGNAPIYACRAWVNFNGTGTIAIRGSGNVSSLTDHGTGAYTINFSTAMPDVNYAVLPGCESESAYPDEVRAVSVRYNSRATGSVRVNAGKVPTPLMDVFGIFVGIFR